MIITNNIKKTYLTILVLLFFAAAPPVLLAKYGYIDITNPFIRKIPLGIPLLKTFSKNHQEPMMAKKTADLISETLQFTGYFKLLDRSSFLEFPQKSGITATNIKFKNWTSIGAELLITGGLLIKGDKIEMELRLYDTFKKQLLTGKRYKGKTKDYRRIVRRFCSRVIFKLTKNKGFFNSKIAFVSTGTGNKEIYICDFDGYNPKKFTNSRNITLSPAWSSNGKWLAYTSYMKKHPDLYIKNLISRHGTIVAQKGINTSPAWVPGKFELAATFSFTGDQDIHLLTGKGKFIKKLTKNRGIDSSPSWSPSGKMFAFVSKRSGTPQIYIKNLVTGNVIRLTFNGKYNTQPSWSPGGNKITYSSMTRQGTDIYVIDVNGNNLTRLTSSKGDNESPSWAPDGSLIAFSSTRKGGIPRIYIMTAYGTDQRQLLSVPGQQTSPAWSPEIMNN